jgi:diguanylate cyclase (GGDEF)-like protein/PAS domain S-box-containing protein
VRNTPALPATRILVIDDNDAIHRDFQKILCGERSRSVASAAEIALFGSVDTYEVSNFQIDFARQGQEGLALVRAAKGTCNPYSLAFIDIRMPPGWDGMETTMRIWQIDPDIQIVICTAYSDYSWSEMLSRVGRSDRMVILKKPFDTIEVMQLATALSEKWRLARQSCAMLDALEHRITERTHELVLASEQLKVSETQYRLLFDRNPHPMWVYDLKTLSFLAVNDAAMAHYGYSEAQFLAMSIRDIRPAEDVPPLEDYIRHLPELRKESSTWRHRKQDGTVIRAEISSEDILFDARPARLVLAHDVTERFDQERKIQRLTRIRAVIGGISSAMLRRTGRDELLQEACRVAVTDGVFPMAWASVLNEHTQQWQIVAAQGTDPQSLEKAKSGLSRMLEMQNRPSFRTQIAERPLVLNDLSKVPAWVSISEDASFAGFASAAAFPLIVEGRIVSLLVLMTRERDFFDAEEVALLQWLTADLSFALEHIAKSQQLDYLAYYDALTGLPNARLFRDRLDQMIHTAQAENSEVCLVAVDLERFTQINDSLGRSAGDELLREVGARFGVCLSEPYVLGRIGADTFVVASPCDPDMIATRLHERMDNALKAPFVVDGREVRVSAQAGISLFPADGHDGDTVFKNAEAALKFAKAGGHRFAYHSGEMTVRIAHRHRIEEELRIAIKAQQFVLHYQPRVDMINGALIGAEALIRWQHPQQGLLPPAEFISLAEETGLIVPIGAWVIGAVCAQQAAWIAAGLPVVPIAVNLSSVQLASGDLLQTVRDALATHSLEAKLLGLELTESSVMINPDAAATTLQALRRLGVGLSLDDFGTGYSSLAHLKRFPFDSVKIDLSFVTDITRNPEDAAIASAIIAMAHRLGLKVVAEGVETEGQFNCLRAQGCDEMQGHFFSCAVPAEVLESDLRNFKRMAMPPAEPADERTLLLVDDDAGTRAALTRLVRRDGYRVLSASSGAEGLDLLALHSVQVIISDQRMPEMSGSEFLSKVKQLYPDTVRIILSGYTDLAVVTDSVNRGAVFKLLTKPWDDDLLRDQVRDAFRRYRPGQRRDAA